MSDATARRLLEDTDLGPKFEAIRTLFREQFSVMGTEEQLRIWLQCSSQFTAMLISEAVKEKMIEEGPFDFIDFLVNSRVSGHKCSAAFCSMLDDILVYAQEQSLGRLGGRHE